MEKISAPLPIAVIGWLLGVPEADWPKLFDWTNRMLGARDPEYRDRASPAETVRAAEAERVGYFGRDSARLGVVLGAFGDKPGGS